MNCMVCQLYLKESPTKKNYEATKWDISLRVPTRKIHNDQERWPYCKFWIYKHNSFTNLQLFFWASTSYVERKFPKSAHLGQRSLLWWTMSHILTRTYFHCSASSGSRARTEKYIPVNIIQIPESLFSVYCFLEENMSHEKW